MTVTGIANYVKPMVADGTFFYLSTTCLKSFYTSHMTDITFDDEAEIVSWKDVEYGILYHFDYADINMAVARPNNEVVPGFKY
jgi:hypothetical protein